MDPIPTTGENINHTGSTNDSQMSSPSGQRGLSSDDGWRSETETSDGDLGLSQYPLDDQSGDESPRVTDSAHEEMLTSAISEISKDLLSGNFSSPMKCASGSVDSDSYSDGDVKLSSKGKGAAYVHYPESATGMSDCDWNPYESDNPEFTPRSSCSETPALNNPLVSTATAGIISNNGTSLEMKMTAGKEAETGHLSDTKSGSNSGGESDEASTVSGLSSASSTHRQPNVQTFTASFALKPDEHQPGRRESGGDLPVHPSPVKPTDQNPCLVLKTPNPIELENTNNSAIGKDEVRRSAESSYPLRSQESGFLSVNSVERREAGSGAGSSSDSEKHGPQGAFSDSSVSTSHITTVTKETPAKISMSESSSDSQRTNEQGYVPITDREKLLGLAASLSAQESHTSHSDLDSLSTGSKNTKDIDTASVSSTTSQSTVIRDENFAQGDTVTGDLLTQRVNKLLSQANSLGISLHKQLYSREALGLPANTEESRESSSFKPLAPDFGPEQDYVSKAMSDKMLSTSDERTSPNVEGKLVQNKGNDSGNVSNTGKSELSSFSSLGDEVASVLTRPISDDDAAKKEAVSKRSSEEIRKEYPTDIETLKSLYRQEKEAERLMSDRQRHGSSSSTDSTDTLGLKVKSILSNAEAASKFHEPTSLSSTQRQLGRENVDIKKLQQDLQDIQNSLQGSEVPRENLPNLDVSLSDKTGESLGPESARNRNMLWDHAGDIGINNSDSGYFLTTNKTDCTETESDSTRFSKDLRPTTTSEYIPSIGQVQKNLGMGTGHSANDSSNLAPDVEEIIRRYQAIKELEERGTTVPDGIAHRVNSILASDSPQKQVHGILEEAMNQEREMMQRIANQPKMDSSYDSCGLPSSDTSYILTEKDIKKQLDWSKLSALENSVHDKTAMSDLSFLRGGNIKPFSALGNAQTFLSSQLQKMSERTFDHSIELRTPYRNAISCYPVYGVEIDKNGKKTETDSADRQTEVTEEREETTGTARPLTLGDYSRTPMLANSRFYLTPADTETFYPLPYSSHRRLSDPHDHSSNYLLSTDRHNPHGRSRSEEAKSFDSIGADARRTSSPHSEKTDSHLHRQEPYGGNSPKSDGSPGSNTSGLSQNDSDSNTHRREGPKLRPYRPYGSRDLYYTEDVDDSGSLVDSVTTVESTHTEMQQWKWNSPDFVCKSNLFDLDYHDERDFRKYIPRETTLDRQSNSYQSEYDYLGSDDAVGPTFPSHLLGTRKDPVLASGIYSNKQNPLSTIEERSLVGDPRSSTDSGVEHRTDVESLTTVSTDRRPDSGLDLQGSHIPTERSHRDVGRGYLDRPAGRQETDRPIFNRLVKPDSRDNVGRVEDVLNSDTDVPVTLSRPVERVDDVLDAGKTRDPYADGKNERDRERYLTGGAMGYDQEAVDRVLEKYAKTSDQMRYNDMQRHKRHGDDIDKPSSRDAERDVETYMSKYRSESVHRAYDMEYRLGGSHPNGGRDVYNDLYRPTTSGSDLREDPMSATTRSDPGEALTSPEYLLYDNAYMGNPLKKDYSDDHLNPVRLRSKSETDLNDISHETHRNSSPIHGSRLMEFSKLSYQPSPILSYPMHCDRVENQVDQRDLIMSERQLHRQLQPGKDYNNYDEERGARYASSDVNQRDTRGSNISKFPVEHAKISATVPYCDRTGKPLTSPSEGDVIRPLEPGRDLVSEPLEPGKDFPLGKESQTAESLQTKGALNDDGQFQELEPLPDSDFEEELMKEKEALLLERHEELLRQKEALIKQREEQLLKEKETFLQSRKEQLIKEIQANAKAKHKFVPLISEEEPDVAKEIDQIPLSKKVHILREKLEKEYENYVTPGLNDMWLRFKEMNDHPSDQSSTMDTPRIDTLTSLIHNPTKHMVKKLMDDKTYERVKEEKLLKELEEIEKAQKELEEEKNAKKKVEKDKKKIDADKRKREIERIRREAEHRRQISESESNGSYSEILAQQELRKKKDTREGNKSKQEKNQENEESLSSKVPVNSMDTLYSIPEDISMEASPSVGKSSPSKIRAKQNRHKNVIDPLMSKLRDKVKVQREKIEKERRKELKRMDKLKKLEQLLKAKKKGSLSDKAIDVELGMVSSTSLTTSADSSSLTTLIDTDATESEATVVSSAAATIETTSQISSQFSSEIPFVEKAYPQQRLATKSIAKTAEKEAKDLLKRSKSNTKTNHYDVYLEAETSEEDSIFARPMSSKVKKRSDKARQHNKKEDLFAEKSKSQINNENLERFFAKMDTGVSTKSSLKKANSPVMEAYKKVRKSPERFHISEKSLAPHKSRNKSPSGRKSRDIGVNIPSPMVISPPTRKKKSKKVYMVSEAVQTSPYAPPRNERGVIPVPLMSPKQQRRKPSPSPVRRTSKSPSKLTSKSPSRSRSTSAKGRRSPAASPSRSSLSPERSRYRERHLHEEKSFEEVYEDKSKPAPKSKIFTPETPEDTCIATLKDSPHRGVCWYIPIEGETKPWKKPFREQQANALRQEPWQPVEMHPADWKSLVFSDVLTNGVSEYKYKSTDTKFDLDTKGQRLGKSVCDDTLHDSDEENCDPKPFTKMTLQEAFQLRKQRTISHVKERQKRLELSRKERQLEDYLEQERKEIFLKENKRKEANPEAHPYSENLHKPKKRTISKEEMKELTKRLYKKLPEVQKMKNIKKRDDDYALNRLRARVFNRKVQNQVLKKMMKAR